MDRQVENYLCRSFRACISHINCQYLIVMLPCRNILSVQRCVSGLNNIFFLYGLATVFPRTTIYRFTFYTSSVVFRRIFYCKSCLVLLCKN
nr:11kDa-protein [Grapevine leafroll-associated virus 1]